MVDNQLARSVSAPGALLDYLVCRYSKVLTSNIGNVYLVAPLPSCLATSPLPPWPLNTSHPESLAQVGPDQGSPAHLSSVAKSPVFKRACPFKREFGGNRPFFARFL